VGTSRCRPPESHPPPSDPTDSHPSASINGPAAGSARRALRPGRILPHSPSPTPSPLAHRIGSAPTTPPPPQVSRTLCPRLLRSLSRCRGFARRDCFGPGNSGGGDSPAVAVPPERFSSPARFSVGRQGRHGVIFLSVGMA
jgi:hypothetical protein